MKEKQKSKLKDQWKIEEKESWTTVRTQMLTAAVMQVIQQVTGPWSKGFSPMLDCKLQTNKKFFAKPVHSGNL